MNIDIFYGCKSGFRHNVVVLDLGSQEKRQCKDIRLAYLASDCSATSGWTFSQILNMFIFKILPI